MAHPTKHASSNSAVLITGPFELMKAKDFLERDVPMMMYRFLWLIIEERSGLMPLEVDMNALPSCVKYVTNMPKTSRLNQT